MIYINTIYDYIEKSVENKKLNMNKIVQFLILTNILTKVFFIAFF